LRFNIFYFLGGGLFAADSSTLRSSLAAELADMQRIFLRMQALKFLEDDRSAQTVSALTSSLPPSQQAAFIQNVVGANKENYFKRYSRLFDRKNRNFAKKLVDLPPIEQIEIQREIIGIIESKLSCPVKALAFQPLVDLLEQNCVHKIQQKEVAPELEKEFSRHVDRLARINSQLVPWAKKDLYLFLKDDFTRNPGSLNPAWFDGGLDDFRDFTEISRGKVKNLDIARESPKEQPPLSPEMKPVGKPFFWGVSTSGYQWEGNSPAGHWIPFENAGKVPDKCGLAANGLKYYRTDAKLAAKMGLNAFRFSIE